MTLQELPEEDKVVVYLYGTLQGLADKGLVELRGYRIATKGLAWYDQLQADGYKPQDEDLASALRHFVACGYIKLTSKGDSLAELLLGG